MTGEPQLVVSGLSKAYEKAGERIVVLENLELSLHAGQSLSIVGQSGVGKSTLLHCLGLVDTFDSGSIQWNGELFVSAGEQEARHRAALRRRYFGFVFQFHYLMSELTALENVSLSLLLSGVGRREAQEKAAAYLAQLGLSHRLNHRPSELSGGEQQRVAIARALVHEPKIILADEPTGNLDPKTAEHVFDVLREQCLRLKAILIMATHHMGLAAKVEIQKNLQGGRLQ
jgi:lipoprotein-releasing system ATP-binding protein